MKKILIMGSLPENWERRKLYETLETTCSDYGQLLSSPIATAEFKGSGRERYELAFERVKESDLIIAELSIPSTGQGMEIREAAILNKPVGVVAQKGSKISGLVTNCPAVKEIIFYETLEELKLKLPKWLKRSLY